MNWYKKALNEDFNTDSKWMPINSSWMTDVAYHKSLQIFEIKVKNGGEYRFNDVPEEVFKAFMESSSKGEFYNQHIRDKYTS